MADEKLSDLDAVTSIDGTAILYVVVDPSGTPLDRQMTVANFVTSTDGLISHNNLADLNSGDPHSLYASLEGRDSQTLNGSNGTGNLGLNSNPSNNGDIILDNFVTITGGAKVGIGPVPWSGTHTNALAFRNGTASVSVTDSVVVYAADFAAGDSRLNFKSEIGSNVVVGNGQVRADTIVSLIATGTAPFTVSSTTVVTNLNADKLDGKDAPSGDIVGTTDTQTLTNKTITSPTFSGTFAGTYTIGGTPTFPSTVVLTTGSQTLTGKTIVVASNTITTAASGNLTSTNLNAALAELQTDIDTRATSSALTSHANSVAQHGIVSTIVGTAEVQTLTSKTLDASLNTITGLDRTGTLANLPKTGLTEGMIYRASNGMLPFRWNNTKWQTLNLYGIPVEDGLTHLSAPNFKWTLTGSGTNEYACELIGGGNPSLTEPGGLFIQSSTAHVADEATKGTVGSLAAGTWGWGNYSGFNTVHVRLSDGADPDSKDYGWIKVDSYSWTGGAGSATAHIVNGHPLLTSTQTGSALLRTRTIAVPGTPWVYYQSMHPIHGLSGENGVGLCITDGTKFRSILAYLDTATSRIMVSVYNWDTNTTGKTQLTLTGGVTSFPFDLIRTHGTPMFAAVDNGTNCQFFMGASPEYMWNVYTVARTTHLTPTRVGHCLTTVSGGNARSWFPARYFG